MLLEVEVYQHVDHFVYHQTAEILISDLQILLVFFLSHWIYKYQIFNAVQNLLDDFDVAGIHELE